MRCVLLCASFWAAIQSRARNIPPGREFLCLALSCTTQAKSGLELGYPRPNCENCSLEPKPGLSCPPADVVSPFRACATSLTVPPQFHRFKRSVSLSLESLERTRTLPCLQLHG